MLNKALKHPVSNHSNGYAGNAISPTVSVSMYHCICSRTGYTGQAAILRFPRFLRYYNFDLFFDRLDAALPFPTFVRLSRWVPGYPGRRLKGDITSCRNLWNLCWKRFFVYLSTGETKKEFYAHGWVPTEKRDRERPLVNLGLSSEWLRVR